MSQLFVHWTTISEDSVLASLLVSCIEANHTKNIANYNYVMACLGPCRHRTVHLIIIIHAYRREKTENVYSHEYYDDHEKILRMKIISIPQFYLVWCVAVQFWRCQSSHQKDHHSYKYLQVHTKNIFGIT